MTQQSILHLVVNWEIFTSYISYRSRTVSLIVCVHAHVVELTGREVKSFGMICMSTALAVILRCCEHL